MEWAEEDIAALVEQRSELLCMVAHQERGGPAVDCRSEEQVNDAGNDLAELKRRLGEIEARLADAGISFDG